MSTHFSEVFNYGFSPCVTIVILSFGHMVITQLQLSLFVAGETHKRVY